MRRDILHWEKAVDLARKIKPAELPKIAKEYANQLEFLGKYDEALKHYEDAVLPDTEDPEKIDFVSPF